jgi:hypothetical protein
MQNLQQRWSVPLYSKSQRKGQNKDMQRLYEARGAKPPGSKKLLLQLREDAVYGMCSERSC